MPALMLGAIWLLLVLYLLSRALRQFGAHRRATLRSAPARPRTAPVAIVVPVRNEAANITTCLAGLAAQRDLPPGSSLTIVDDGSEDGTAEIVQRWIGEGQRVRLVGAGALPEGWVGKPHACWRGALTTESAWLCFIDADVRVAPPLVAAAVHAAETGAIDMLSLHPFQELGSFWERLVMPAGLLAMACAKRLRRTDGPASSAALANGQFILIRREVYFAIGGHAAVSAEFCEDRALAVLVEEAGYRFAALGAEHVATTRMYRDFTSLWAGLARNAAEILGSPGLTFAASVGGLIVGWATPMLPLLLAAAIYPPRSAISVAGLALAAAGSLVVVAVQLGTARHFGVSAIFAVLMPLGYTVAAAIAAHSLVLRHSGRIAWKGRRYDFRRTPSAGRP